MADIQDKKNFRLVQEKVHVLSLSDVVNSTTVEARNSLPEGKTLDGISFYLEVIPGRLSAHNVYANVRYSEATPKRK